MNKSVLILPDVHTHVKFAQAKIDHVKPDLTIYLGDTWDQFNDTALQNKEAADWLKSKIHNDNFIWLWANHDVSYYSHKGKRNYYASCSGFTPDKFKAINSVMTEKDWNKAKWFYILDNKYLITHAGLHPSHLPEGVNMLNQINEFLTEQSKKADIAMRDRKPHWFYEAGYSRGGRAPFGGILWLDWLDEFTEIKGISQCIGHTARSEFPIRKQSNTKTLDYCLDSPDGSLYATYSNKKLQVWRVIDNKDGKLKTEKVKGREDAKNEVSTM